VDFVADKVVSGGRDKVVKMCVSLSSSPIAASSAYTVPCQMEALTVSSADLTTEILAVTTPQAFECILFIVSGYTIQVQYPSQWQPMRFMRMGPTFLMIATHE
jgi:hypothetical protein